MKQALNLGTDQGTNVLSILGFTAVTLSQMPDGNVKSILLTIISLAGCVVLYLIKGEKKEIDMSKPLEDVLREGREDGETQGD